jgi:hypothetical protein
MKTISISQTLPKLLTALLLVTSMVVSAQSNLVTNPGFSNGTQGWSTNCTIEINPESVYGGTNSNPVTEIDIERCLHQEIATSAGAIYDFSFKAGRRQGSTPATVGITVKVIGVPSGVEYINQNRTYTNTSWSLTTESFSFTVPANTTDTRVRIEFTNYVTPGTYGTLVDDISLSVNAQSAVLALKPTHVIRRNNNNTVSASNIYPNPATSTINYAVKADAKTSANLMIYNISGAVVVNKQVQLNKGANVIALDITALKTGSFYLKLADNEGMSYVKSFCKN